MRRDLRRRLEKLEAQVVAGDQKLSRLAARLHVDPERLRKAVQGHEAELAKHLIEDGITWEGFLLVGKCLGWNTHSRPVAHAGRHPPNSSARE
jgi:hypothetical protein